MSKLAVRRAGAVFLSVLTLAALSPAIALAQQGQGQGRPAHPVTVPVTGTFTLAGQAQPFTGTFTIERFAEQAGQVVAIGTLNDPNTKASLPLTLPVQLPGQTPTGQAVTAQQAAASCQVLDLVLGPLHLDLLGLVIDLNQVHLEITAQQGQGNLLGNLLCAVANLLNGPGGGAGGGGLGAIVNLLNQILAAL